MLAFSRLVAGRIAGAGAGWRPALAEAATGSRAVSSTQPARGLEELFDSSSRKPDEYPQHGRAWLASDLRRKSFDDLHKLWYVLLKERHLLNTEREMYKIKGQQMPAVMRITKVRKSMARIKFVLSERACAEQDEEKRAQMKHIIHSM